MKNLAQKRAALLAKLETHCEFLRGSVTDVCATCSRANCICKRKSSRRSHRLTYKDAQQKTKTVFIPRGKLGQVRKMISNYQRIRKITEQLVEINVEIFKQSTRISRD
jgi:hypothetical protein